MIAASRSGLTDARSLRSVDTGSSPVSPTRVFQVRPLCSGRLTCSRSWRSIREREEERCRGVILGASGHGAHPVQRQEPASLAPPWPLGHQSRRPRASRSREGCGAPSRRGSRCTSSSRCCPRGMRRSGSASPRSARSIISAGGPAEHLPGNAQATPAGGYTMPVEHGCDRGSAAGPPGTRCRSTAPSGPARSCPPAPAWCRNAPGRSRSQRPGRPSTARCRTCERRAWTGRSSSPRRPWRPVDRRRRCRSQRDRPPSADEPSLPSRASTHDRTSEPDPILTTSATPSLGARGRNVVASARDLVIATDRIGPHPECSPRTPGWDSS